MNSAALQNEATASSELADPSLSDAVWLQVVSIRAGSFGTMSSGRPPLTPDSPRRRALPLPIRQSCDSVVVCSMSAVLLSVDPEIHRVQRLTLRKCRAMLCVHVIDDTERTFSPGRESVASGGGIGIGRKQSARSRMSRTLSDCSPPAGSYCCGPLQHLLGLVVRPHGNQ
jgi:hypothetical protein